MRLPPLVRGQRVLVRRCGEPGDEKFLGGVPGTVVRPRMCDNGAWVALDQRSSTPGAHPFAADDTRGRHVLAYPCDCAPLTDGAA